MDYLFNPSHMYLGLIDPNKPSNRYCQFHFWMHDYSISLDEAFFLGPQLFLGITFNPIFIVHAITESITLGSFIFFFAIFCWVVAYDTYYGLCDIEDDKKLGINSTPLWWKGRTQNLIFGFQFLFIVSLYFVGNFYAFSSYWIFALMVISLFFVYQSHLAKNNEYLSAFKNNKLSWHDLMPVFII